MSYSIDSKNTDDSQFSRQGQAAGITGALINFVAGKGNTLTAPATTTATGAPEVPKWLWIVLGVTAAGGAVFILLRKRKK